MKLTKYNRYVIRTTEYESCGWRHELVDTTTNTVVGSDGGEPEDNSFGRDWAWVPVLLNQLAAQLEIAESALAAARLEISARENRSS